MHIVLFIGPGYGRALLRAMLRSKPPGTTFNLIFFNLSVCHQSSYLFQNNSSVLEVHVFDKGWVYQKSLKYDHSDGIFLLWWPEILPHSWFMVFIPINIHLVRYQ